MNHTHPQRQEVLDRLARIEGHLRAVRKMSEEGKPCADVLHQIGAVQAALRKVAQVVLEDHLDRCVIGATDKADMQDIVESLKTALATYVR